MDCYTESTGMTPAFKRNNRVRTIVGFLYTFAHGEGKPDDRFWLTREECRLLEEFLTRHRAFFGMPPVEEELDGRQREDS